MEITGKTIDGKPVVSGVGKLCFTSGLPLEVVLHRLKEKGWVVDWVNYMIDALNDGHNPRTIRARIMGAIGDVYGGAYLEEFANRLDEWIPPAA